MASGIHRTALHDLDLARLTPVLVIGHSWKTTALPIRAGPRTGNGRGTKPYLFVDPIASDVPPDDVP